MARWTGDRWRSGRHRVLPPPADAPAEELISLVYFYECDPGTTVRGIDSHAYLRAQLDAITRLPGFRTRTSSRSSCRRSRRPACDQSVTGSPVQRVGEQLEVVVPARQVVQAQFVGAPQLIGEAERRARLVPPAPGGSGSGRGRATVYSATRSTSQAVTCPRRPCAPSACPGQRRATAPPSRGSRTSAAASQPAGPPGWRRPPRPRRPGAADAARSAAGVWSPSRVSLVPCAIASLMAPASAPGARRVR